MAYRFAVIAAVLFASGSAEAQQPPIPLLPSPQATPSAGSSIEATPLAPPPATEPQASAPQTPEPAPPMSTAPTAGATTPADQLSVPPPAQPGAPPAMAGPAPAGRVFCDQSVSYRVVDPATVPAPFQQYVGIFSDAAWTPQICAALVVESVQQDGTATITYVFGPMATGGKPPGGALHGTGIVKDGALVFQNTDGSQYAFKPFYSDLAGAWTTPQGQTYSAIFKRSY